MRGDPPRRRPRADVYELTLPAGHFGLVVGSQRHDDRTWPAVADWVRLARRRAQGEPPEPVATIPRPRRPRRGRRPTCATASAIRLELAGGVGAGHRALGRRHGAAHRARRARPRSRGGRPAAAARAPRAARPDTRISLGSLLDERAASDPEEVLFLFGDRAYTAGAVNRRIDNVVRGLIAIGVRQGEHVGVLMGRTRPRSRSLAALSRLGAVAVLLRPDGDSPARRRSARVRRIVADPERAAQAAERTRDRPHVRAARRRGRRRHVAASDPGLTSTCEPIDVADRCDCRAGTAPIPVAARDVAFILFTGEGEAIRMSRITNGRWVTVGARHRLRGGALIRRHRLLRDPGSTTRRRC